MNPDSFADCRPFSPACEENRIPILHVLQQIFSSPCQLLEIGSGTGQHAVYFSAHLPHVQWQPSDVAENLPGIRLWLTDAPQSNLLPPLILDVTQTPWPVTAVDAIFSANTAHIMSWSMVERMMRGIGKCLHPDGYFCLYGPFKYHGAHTSESNARFDMALRQQNPQYGVRDFHKLDEIARQHNLHLLNDYAMPANNRILVWRKQPA